MSSIYRAGTRKRNILDPWSINTGYDKPYIVDRIYKHADVIFRVACNLCTTTFLCACLWALIYIQTHAEDVATRFEKMRTQL